MDVEAPVWCSTRDLKKLIILGPSHLRLCVHLSVLNESTSHSARNLHHPAIVASFLDVNRPHLLQLLERQCAHRLLLATVSIVRGFNACSCRSPQGRAGSGSPQAAMPFGRHPPLSPSPLVLVEALLFGSLHQTFVRGGGGLGQSSLGPGGDERALEASLRPRQRPRRFWGVLRARFPLTPSLFTGPGRLPWNDLLLVDDGGGSCTRLLRLRRLLFPALRSLERSRAPERRRLGSRAGPCS